MRQTVSRWINDLNLQLWGIDLCYMAATCGHLKFITMKWNKNSVSPPHWPYLKCSIATCGWWLQYQTSQIIENFHYGRKCFWRWPKLLCALYTHVHTPHGITGTLQWSYEEGHLTPRDLVWVTTRYVRLPCFWWKEELFLEEIKGCAFHAQLQTLLEVKVQGDTQLPRC